MTEPRPLQHLRTLRQDIPDVWRHAEAYRAQRGKGLPHWPDWCYLPLAASYAILSGGGENRLEPSQAVHVGPLGALMAWRPTQGIYRYDPTLREALLATDLSRGIPRGALYHLPGWCVYIEDEWTHPTIGVIHGYYAALEWDAHDQHAELRLATDWGDHAHWRSLIPFGIHLIADDLMDCLDPFFKFARDKIGGDLADRALAEGKPIWDRALRFLLYLCSEGPDIHSDSPQARKGRPKPTPAKGGEKIFPPTHPSIWETGFRLGRMIRDYEAREHQGGSVRPHLRRAHWHTFLRGPRDQERTRVLRWLPPIPVNIDATDDIEPTIYRIEEN